MAPFFENFGMDNIWEEIPARHGRAQVPLHAEVTRMEVVAEEAEAEAVEQSEEESIDESDYDFDYGSETSPVEQSEDESIEESHYMFDYEFDYGSET